MTKQGHLLLARGFRGVTLSSRERVRHQVVPGQIVALLHLVWRLDGGRSEVSSSWSRPRLRAFWAPEGSRGFPEDMPCRSGELRGVSVNSKRWIVVERTSL